MSITIVLLIGLITASILTYLLYRKQAELAEERERIVAIEAINTHLRHALEEQEKRYATLEEQEKALQVELRERYVAQRLLEQEKAQMEQSLQESQTNQKEINQLLEERFRSITTQILEERAESLHKRSEESLNPLREDLKRFGEQVQKAYDSEARERHTLQAEIRRLVEQSDRISADANSLTQALKGGNKIQGNWGEMILEDLLESSGLERGRHFYTQEQYTDADTGERLIPDVVIHYPNGGRMIIDSKVNLKDYMAYVNATEEAERRHYAERHLEAVRNQIKLLQSKHYSSRVEGSPDFVILFIPNEPAYLLAMHQAPTLWSEAYDRKVLIMNTTNLMASLKMAEELWRREQQRLNVEEIFKKVGDLYDQLYTYIDRLEQTSKHLEKAQDTLSDTRKSLSSGRGNVLRRIEELRKMGAKPKKELRQLIDKSPLLSLDGEEAEG